MTIDSKFTKLKLKLAFTALLTPALIAGFAQVPAKIGQDAREIKASVEWLVRDRTGYDSFGNAKWNNLASDVKYYDGAISEVILCFSQQLVYDLRMKVDFCKYYVMENGRLSYVLTQYENVSLSRVKAMYDQSSEYQKIGESFYSKDYEHCSKIYLHPNGLATVEWKAANVNNLPAQIKTEVVKKRQQQEEANRQRAIAEQKAKQREQEILSKIYDLQEYSPSDYSSFLINQRMRIEKYFKENSYYPSFERPGDKSERFTNSYNVHYVQRNESTEQKVS